MPTAPRRPCSRPGCPHLAPCPTHVRHREVGQRYIDRKHEPGRALYSLAKWKRRRLAFLKANPLCVLCAQTNRLVLAAVVDHVQPHKGNEALMWDEANWRALCASCHGRVTAAQTWHSA